MNLHVKSRLTSVIGASIIFFGITTSAMAVSLGFGVSGGATHVEVGGTETMTGSNKTTTDKGYGNSPLGSVYGQVTVGEGRFGESNGFTLGYEHFFGSANLNAKKSPFKADLVKAGTTTGHNHASATVKNLQQIYLETPGFTVLGLYLKAGWSQMDVVTTEDLFTGGQYGDASVDGATWGVGFKKSAGGVQIKTEFNYTDWDDISLTNTGKKVDAVGASKIDASPENWAFKFGIGYNF